MRLPDAIDAFVLTKATSVSEKTLGWYEQKLTHFAGWAKYQSPPVLRMEDVTVHVVRRYLDAAKRSATGQGGKPLSSYTMHGYAECVKMLLYRAVREEVVPDKFSKRLEMPKVAKKVVQTFSPHEISVMLDVCEQQPYPALVWRDKATIAVLVDTGIRASELCGLTIERVSLTAHGGQLRVHGKGDKQQDVPLRSKEARVLLHRYVTRYRERLDTEQSPYLFLDTERRRLHPHAAPGVPHLMHQYPPGSTPAHQHRVIRRRLPPSNRALLVELNMVADNITYIAEQFISTPVED